MATAWDPIDPDDIVDLFVDFGGPSSKPFLPVPENPTSVTVTVPAEVNKITSDIVTGTKIVRLRVGPCESGKHALQYHLVTDAGQEFDATVSLTVKERIKG